MKVNVKGLVLGGVAVALIVVSFIGLEKMAFPGTVDEKAMRTEYSAAAEGGLTIGGRLKNLIVQPWKQKNLIAKRSLPELNGQTNTETKEDIEEQGLVTLRVMGIMRGADGRFVAIVNGSLVDVGSMVGGCSVQNITENAVEVKIGDAVKKLRINEEVNYKPTAFRDLVLQDLVGNNNVWKAKINGSFYRAGDNIDRETVIRAITPRGVMVIRAGTVINLKLPKK